MNAKTVNTNDTETTSRIPADEQHLIDSIAKIKSKKNKTAEDQDNLDMWSDDLKQRKFKRLATARMNAALKSISLIGNLSSKSQYLYTEQETKAMQDALISEIAQTFTKFDAKSGNDDDKGFSFG